MSLINEVKKALGRSGIEMDADDVASQLACIPGPRRRVTRTQVANALAALAASDPNVIRTRLGLYQYVTVDRRTEGPPFPP